MWNNEVLRRVGALVTMAVGIGSPQTPAAQSTAVVPDEAPRALALTYADGRTARQVLRPSGGSWTPFFPRVAGAETSQNGLPLAALDIAHALDGPDVRVTVSLIYGTPHQHRVTVANVTVNAQHAVRVDELRAYGVEPVMLSIVTVRPASPLVLSVSTPSSALEVSVEALSTGEPKYQIVLVNRSAHALMAFQYEGYRADGRLFSGRKKTARHTPLVQPGEQYVFPVPAMAASDRALQMTLPERVAITSVIWDDGIVEGEAAPAANEEALAAGAARQIPRVLVLLRSKDAPTILRGRIEALSIDVSSADAAAVHSALPDPTILTVDAVRFVMSNGMQQVKDAALADVDTFIAGNSAADSERYMRWLEQLRRDYADWLARVPGRKG